MRREESLEDTECTVSFTPQGERYDVFVISFFFEVLLCGRGSMFPDDYFNFLKWKRRNDLGILLFWSIILVIGHIFLKGSKHRIM